MGDFYSEMAAMASNLLAPTSAGGLGQGTLILSRSTPGVPGPNPWDPVVPVVANETLRGAVRGVSARLVGTEVGGSIILASDRQAICAVPQMSYVAGDTMTVDGVPVHVVAVERIPAAGVQAAVRFIIRG